jgi:hypothetical protein
MNCVYWDARFPRLLTKRQMKRLAEEGNDRYVRRFVIGDGAVGSDSCTQELLCFECFVLNYLMLDF